MLNDEQSMLQRFKRSLSKNSINQRELRAREWRGFAFLQQKRRSHVEFWYIERELLRLQKL